MGNDPKKRKKDNKKDNKKIYIGLAILVLIVLVTILGITLYVSSQEEKDKELAYTELIKEISYGNIEKVEMTVNSTKVNVKIKNQEEIIDTSYG